MPEPCCAGCMLALLLGFAAGVVLVPNSGFLCNWLVSNLAFIVQSDSDGASVAKHARERLSS